MLPTVRKIRVYMKAMNTTSASKINKNRVTFGRLAILAHAALVQIAAVN